jgi:hypothetical protein
VPAELAPEAVPDAGAFLARLVRMDPAALVRFRPVRSGAAEVWARLPFDVLVTRLIRAGLDEDVTVRAAELLDRLERGDPSLPARHDLAWRSPLPPGPGDVLEAVPGREFRRIAQAAADTMRAAAGRGMGERRLRDELLDHVAMVVSGETHREEVPVRLVQAVVRMGFLGADESAPVRVRRSGAWLGAEARFGCAWRRTERSLLLASHHPQ